MENGQKDIAGKKAEDRQPYHTPVLRTYGSISELTEGQLAYSAEEAAYQEMTGP